MNKNILSSKALKYTLSTTFAGLAALVALIWSTNTSEVYAATTAVTATVANSLTCTTDNASTAFGTLTSGAIATAAPTVTNALSCNSGGGCTLYVADAGNGSNPGLYAAAATTSPIILSTTATLSAGTEGYGIQAATSSNGTGAALTLSATYLKTGTNVGGLLIATTQIASSTLPVALKEVVITHKAAISGLTKAGSYSDTITYSCVSN